MVYFKIIFWLALVKLSVSQSLLNSYFKLYAKDFDATKSFIRQYQYYEYKTAGPSKNSGLIECMAYCSRLNSCFSISISPRNDGSFCRVFSSIPLLNSHVTSTNGSFIYVDAGIYILLSLKIVKSFLKQIR